MTCEHEYRPVKGSKPKHVFCPKCGHSWPEALTRLATGKFADLNGKHWSEVASEALGA